MEDQDAVEDSSHRQQDSEPDKVCSQQQGRSRPQRGTTSIEISNARGYLCHISAAAEFIDSPPKLIFALFTNPDNTGVFRDIKRVTSRKVIQNDPAGLKVVEIEQLGETWLLWMHVEFRTRLTVTEDSRDPNNLRTYFELISSDVLNKFNGSWHLQPLRQEGSAASLGTLVHLEQDVSPRGLPEFLKHVPVVSNVLKGVCARAVERLLDDVAIAAQRLDSGEPWNDVVQRSSAEVKSHMLDDFSESGSESESEPGAEEHADSHATPDTGDAQQDKHPVPNFPVHGQERSPVTQEELANATEALSPFPTPDVTLEKPKLALCDDTDDMMRPSS